MKLKLRAQMDYFGILVVGPTDVDVRRAYAEFISEQGIHVHHGVLVLDGHEAREYIKEEIPKELHEQVYDGMPTEFESDTFDYGKRLGYGACWLFQGGKARIEKEAVVTANGIAYRLGGLEHAGVA